MALETVRILVQDDEVVPSPVDDVVVRVYDETGTTLITSATSGAVEDGIAEFTLDGDTVPASYQLRFYINGGTIVSPRLIEVYSPASLAPTGANNFRVDATMFVLPQATDPMLCRCSGYVRGPDGRPKKGIDIHMIPVFNPLIAAGAAVLGERVAIRTDKAGYVSVDLFRSGEYEATIESQENTQRYIGVPDRAAVNIGDLMFPVVAAIEYTPDPISVSAGSSLDVYPEVTTSSFLTLTGSGAEDVIYTVDDQTVASIQVLSDRIVIYGIVAGTTTLRAVRRDLSIVRIPEPGIYGGAVTITVV